MARLLSLPETLWIDHIFPFLQNSDLYSLIIAIPTLEHLINLYRDWTLAFNKKFPGMSMGLHALDFRTFYGRSRQLYSWGRASGSSGMTSLGIDCLRLATEKTHGVVAASGEDWTGWSVSIPQPVEALKVPVQSLAGPVILSTDGRLFHIRGKGQLAPIAGRFRMLGSAMDSAEAMRDDGTLVHLLHGDSPIEFHIEGTILGICDNYYSESALIDPVGLVAFPVGTDSVGAADIEYILSSTRIPGTADHITQMVDYTQGSNFEGRIIPRYEWVFLLLTEGGFVYLIDPFRYLNFAGPCLDMGDHRKVSEKFEYEASFTKRYEHYQKVHGKEPCRTPYLCDERTGVRMYKLLSEEHPRFTKVMPFEFKCRLLVTDDGWEYVLHNLSERAPGFNFVVDKLFESLGFLGLTQSGEVYFVPYNTLLPQKLSYPCKIVDIVAADSADSDGDGRARYSCVYAISDQGDLYVLGFELDGFAGLGPRQAVGAFRPETTDAIESPEVLFANPERVEYIEQQPTWNGVYPFITTPTRVPITGKLQDISTLYRAMHAVVIE